MDLSQHKLINNWETYAVAMEEHGQLDDYEPWPFYLPLHAAPAAPVGGGAGPGGEGEHEEDPEEELGAMKEMMFKIAAMQPVDIDPATIRKPRRRNVRISDDPQSVAARHRRERISEKIRILQRLVPGGTKMDTASMLDEAIRYVKFLKRQIRILQGGPPPPPPPPGAAAAASYLFGGDDGGAASDDPACFNNHQ